MRKRVEQLLNGKFEYETQALVLSETRIELTAKENEVLHGSFTAANPADKKVKGFLYSSNPRVTFDPLEFYGIDNKIYYQIDTSGLAEGESSEGFFTLCTDLGEYEVPYLVRIEKKEKEIDFSKVLTSKELAELARQDFQEAYPVFLQDSFAKGLAMREPGYVPLYEGLKNPDFHYQSLEEFLVGCGEKEAVELSLETEQIQYKNLEQSVRESLTLHKSSWGFLQLGISSDARFLRLEKKSMTTDEFVGSSYSLEYVVDTNFLHAGKNYGRITIRTCYQTLYYEVLVIKKVESEEKRQHHVQKIMQKKLENLYVSFRLKKTDLQTWIDRSENVLNSYQRAGGSSVFADLFRIQLLFADDKKTRAYKLLQDLEKQPHRLNTPESYAFYLYLTTFFNREISYVDQVEARIEQLFLQNRDNWKLQWILLYLQDRFLRDDGAKLEAIEEQVKCGCSSQIMYLEAYLLVRKDPFLLRRLDAFERKFLFFAAKEKVLTAELARQISNLALHSHEFNRILYEILQACYEVYPSAELVKAICMLLMNGDKKEPEHFAWYELGIQYELRVTGLYEYYMEAMEQCSMEKMPQIIRMYFVYNNTLDYRKRAKIYRSVAENRESDPQIYRNYRGMVERFTIEQLSMGRISGDLAVLYDTYLSRQILTKSLAERLVRTLFTFEITCKNPEIQSVAVVHAHRKEEQVVPLNKGKALVQIYTENARIFLLDGEGNRYVSPSLYMAERFMDNPRLLEYCKELVPEHPGLVLYICETCTDSTSVTEQSLPYLKRASEMETLKEEYKEKLRKWILSYYMEHPKDDTLFQYLKGISYTPFIRADKRALMSLLTQEGMYEEAFMLLEMYGSEQVPLLHLVRICSQTVLAREYEENQVLLSYCFQCFGYGKYGDNILNYLLMYYDGPIEDMKRLWSAGHQFELDTMLLEEKILSLLLFTRTGSYGTEAIFISYQHKLGRKKICRAYLILRAYEYFIRGLPVNEVLFTFLEHGYQNGADLEDVCKLALLQHYSGLIELKGRQEENAERLLQEYNGKNMRFAFYQKFPPHLQLPYQLLDKVFVEYVGNPDNTVLLYYRMKGRQEEYSSERMLNCFEGIYVKEFVLFYGEELECYTEETCGSQVKKSDRRVLTSKAQLGDGNSRFELLNRISLAQQQRDEEKIRTELETWRQLEYLAKEVFTLI
ncbi:MAG: DUF5717 family protein [Lachnospiraceae bacterium]|nr:DUF5717 family protein [Lachnospiraceae bacterium]